MPSGAKKRKAAKKKQASNSYSAPPPSSSSTHSQSGDDDLKHCDGRDSDGGDVEGLEKSEDSSSVRSFISEGKSNARKGTGSSSSSSSGSSSSDDESHVVEKKIVVVEDAPTTVDLVEPLESFPVKVTQVVDDLVKPIDILSEGVKSSLIGEADNLEVETPSVEKVSSVEQVVHVIQSVSIENGSSSHVTESKSEDEKVLVTEESDANPGNGGCHVEESEISQYSDSQPLVASSPRIVQTTSWKSCCGIFELFTGSNK